jgi:hypothetical protein
MQPETRKDRTMLSTQKQFAIRDLGAALVACLNVETIADLMNGTLCADDDERLSDYQAELVRILFDRICELSPEAMDIAIGNRRTDA